MFKDAPPALLEKIEQVVRLIRSKGVGVFFVTQNPLDVPDRVLGQLGNRVQHALRAFSPRDQKAVRAAADTLRANPAFDAAAAITELGVGEAAPAKGGPFEGLGGVLGGGGGSRQGVIEAAVKSAARSIGSQIGREIVRGVLGSILGGRRR
ncbi:MAG: hypothetical protein IOMNBAOH_00796 [Rhodocyclaceae bacterium]|nr:hypothetical protein [Rhodocyclaceae bacterium]